MVITYHGLEFFKVQLGSTALALGPISKKSKHKGASFGANVVIVPVNHPDMNGVDAVSRGDKEPFVISGPGEYEVQNIVVRGYDAPTEYEGMKHNTVYIIQMEDMRLCYLGALSSSSFSTDLKEALEDIDVLFVPIGDNGVLSPKDAHKLGVSLESRLVIPMHYDDKQLKTFIKEEGVTGIKAIDKLALKQKDLSGKEGEVVVFNVA